ncbi:hypothetical protein V2J09_009907 [Rumex salicifolius]
MAWRNASFSRTLLNSARSASLRSATNASAAPRLRPSHLGSGNLRPRRSLRFTNSRTLEELGCMSSMLPLHSLVSNARLTSYVAVDVRAFCELSQGTFRRTCQDR